MDEFKFWFLTIFCKIYFTYLMTDERPSVDKLVPLKNLAIDFSALVRKSIVFIVQVWYFFLMHRMRWTDRQYFLLLFSSTYYCLFGFLRFKWLIFLFSFVKSTVHFSVSFVVLSTLRKTNMLVLITSIIVTSLITVRKIII